MSDEVPFDREAAMAWQDTTPTYYVRRTSDGAYLQERGVWGRTKVPWRPSDDDDKGPYFEAYKNVGDLAMEDSVEVIYARTGRVEHVARRQA